MIREPIYIDEAVAELLGAESAPEPAECPFAFSHPLGVAWRVGRARAMAFVLTVIGDEA